ncbi:MAG TPA: hypothetical protein VEZ24_16330 [Microvirga sp.]|nr:hypothetical protein [Microvirga sp.]
MHSDQKPARPSLGGRAAGHSDEIGLRERFGTNRDCGVSPLNPDGSAPGVGASVNSTSMFFLVLRRVAA